MSLSGIRTWRRGGKIAEYILITTLIVVAVIAVMASIGRSKESEPVNTPTKNSSFKSPGTH